MNKSIRKRILTATLALTTATAISCGDGKQVQENNDQKPSKPTPEQIEREKQQREAERLQELTDSIAQYNGYQNYAPKLNETRDVRNSYEHKLYLLKECNSKAFELEVNVMNMFAETGMKYVEQGKKELSKYNISVPTAADDDNNYRYYDEDMDNNMSDTARYIIGDVREQINEGLCGLEKVANYYELNLNTPSEDIYNWWERAVKAVNKSDYGEMRKTEIKNILERLVKKMADEMTTKRLKMAQSYAKYYPILSLPEQYRNHINIDDVAYSQDIGEGQTSKSYAGLSTAQKLIVYEDISVYDQNLSVDFFGEEGAKYELKEIKKNQWQIVKTSKGGKVSKTNVFEDKVEPNRWVSSHYNDYITGKPEDSFEYRPGTNKGVRISVRRVLYFKQGENDMLLPEREANARIQICERSIENCDQFQRQADSLQQDASNKAKVLMEQQRKRDSEKRAARNDTRVPKSR